jgi:hypothetical protein
VSPAETYAYGVIARYNARAAIVSSDGPQVARMTGVEVAALVLLIAGEVIKACDLYNPGWRSHPWVRWIPGIGRPTVDSRAIRERARLAIDPDSAGPFQRNQARRDRVMLLNAIRRRSGSLDGTEIDAPELMADSYCDQAIRSTDAELAAAVAELAGP